MHIAVFFQYYHNPDCAATGRHYTFLRHWAERHQITLITTRTWYRKRLTEAFDWVPPGVDIKMLDVPYDNTMRIPQRLLAFQQYVAGAFWHGLRMPRPDVIFGTSTPLTAAWVAGRVARLRRVPWVFEVRDLWPDFPIQMGAIQAPWLQRRLRGLERSLYRHATHTIALSPDMATHIEATGAPRHRISTLVNGTDFDLLERVQPADLRHLDTTYGLAGKKVILYAGTYGRANDIPTVLQAAERLSGHDGIRFVLIGHGFMARQVEAAAARWPHVIALPPQPRHRIFPWMQRADLTLVPFIDRPVLAANSPAKFFDSLGAGTPVIVTNPGWTKRFVEQHRCGWYVPPSDAEALADRIAEIVAAPGVLEQAGRSGAEIARQQFDRRRLAGTLEAILVEAAETIPSA